MIKIILYPFSLLYGLLSWLNRRVSKQNKLPKPVISVGNITWGGTGKTPVVIKLANEFIKQGLKPAVLTRGYNRKIKQNKSVIVSDGRSLLASVEEAGDEPYLIAQEAKGAIVAVGIDRYSIGLEINKKYSPDVFILDDGFQHWKIKRNIDIVCINSRNPFGNGSLIPAGILREPLTALKRADLIVLTSSGFLNSSELKTTENKIKEYTSKDIVFSEYKPSSIKRISDNTLLQIKDYMNTEVLAVSAIGENKGFKETIEKAGLKVKEHMVFRDHHWFSGEDIKNIVSRMKSNEIVITTTKDAVRFREGLNNLENIYKERFYSLQIEVSFTRGGESWVRELKKITQSS